MPFHRIPPAPRRHALIARTDPDVAATAAFVLDAALDPAALPPQMSVRLARRAGVFRTSAVPTRTTLLLLRHRVHLTLPGSAGTKQVVAEDAEVVAYTGPPTTPTWLTPEKVEDLLTTQASVHRRRRAGHRRHRQGPDRPARPATRPRPTRHHPRRGPARLALPGPGRHRWHAPPGPRGRPDPARRRPRRVRVPAAGDPMTAVRTVGSLLPADILAAALDGSLPGMTGADYHLAAGETPRQAASRSWTYLQGVYRSYRDELAKLPAGQTGTALTREKWLQILLRELDYGRVPTTPAGTWRSGARSTRSRTCGPTSRCTCSAGASTWTPAPRRPPAPPAPPSPWCRSSSTAPTSTCGRCCPTAANCGCCATTPPSSARPTSSSTSKPSSTAESFTDFALMWLVCQQSRLERLPGPPDETGEPTEGAITDRWLERWRTHAIETGTRALAELRNQVTKAIEALGTGFLRHPGNDHLRDQLAAGQITTADLQRSLLRTVYRLLFWFVAEDRDALLDPSR